MLEFDSAIFGGRKAPDFAGIAGWLNSKPLSLASLAGKAVLVDFWTYTCINCIRTLPFVKELHEKYSKHGLVVVGVHSPEFTVEKDPKNVREAVKSFGLNYPIALDSDMRTWRAFDNRYWPAKYLIGRDGEIVYQHFGEGGEAETESAIQKALGISLPIEEPEKRNYSFVMSRETYAGKLRGEGLGSSVVCAPDGCDRHMDNGRHLPGTIYLDGFWRQDHEYVELLKGKGSGRFSYKFYAREVNAVIEPLAKQKASVSINVNGKKKTSSLPLDGTKLYNLYSAKDYAQGELMLEFSGPVRVYALTFG